MVEIILTQNSQNFYSFLIVLALGQFLSIFIDQKLSFLDVRKPKKVRQAFWAHVGALFRAIN